MRLAFPFASGISQEVKRWIGQNQKYLIFTAASPVARKWVSWEYDKCPPLAPPHQSLPMHANAQAFSIGFPNFFTVLLCFKQGKGYKSF